MSTSDSLGDRMKRYETVSQSKLMPRSYALIRIDGKAFHTYTKGFSKPWDKMITESMHETLKYLCENIQGVKYGYYQSDEISLVLTDFDTYETSAWFDNKIQKIVSVAASMATARFNFYMLQSYYCHTDEPELRGAKNLADHYIDGVDLHSTQIAVGDIINYMPPVNMLMATFDARAWNVPNRDEVINYFIWRQQDTVRNSISGLAQSLYSAKELNGKNQNEMQEMIYQKGQNWNEVSTHLKQGTGCFKKYIPKLDSPNRTEWYIDLEVPLFNDKRKYFNDKII